MSKKQIVEPTEVRLDDMKKVVGGYGYPGYGGYRDYRGWGGYGQNSQGNNNSQGNEPARSKAVALK
jgi:hypothetical protein